DGKRGSPACCTVTVPRGNWAIGALGESLVISKTQYVADGTAEVSHTTWLVLSRIVMFCALAIAVPPSVGSLISDAFGGGFIGAKKKENFPVMSMSPSVHWMSKLWSAI